MSRIPPGIPLQRSTPPIGEPLSIMRPHMPPGPPASMSDVALGRVVPPDVTDVPFSAPVEPTKPSQRRRRKKKP